MKTILPSVCAVAVLAGCAGQSGDTQSSAYSSQYFRSQVESPTASLQPVGDQQALAARQLALQRQQEQNTYYSSPSYSTPSTSYSDTYAAPGRITESPQPMRLSPPAPVGEQRAGPAPIATPVAGKPGYVLSPFAPQAGYVDVTGLAPGTEAKDPYTGKVFRVP